MQEGDRTTLTPEGLLDVFLGQMGVDWKTLQVPRNAALAFQFEGLNQLCSLSNASPLGVWKFPVSNFPLYIGSYHNEKVLLGKLPEGAPNAVVYVECLICMGVNQIIVTGAAGSIHPGAPAYSLVATTTAIREDGGHLLGTPQ